MTDGSKEIVRKIKTPSSAWRYSPRKRTKKTEQTDKITTGQIEEGRMKWRSTTHLGLLFIVYV
ncbi:hypothetical protein [Methylomicrobium sp. Wu6]|uniref:hypothetical protein n=1 Tax=Methylomicrobium sp. Wu6 TaxID=3107928 RepID=UPI002DD6674C|nr:hypothetical protein [Methylomicrobium sp. Wu6]MEC4750038.1 hypothetical protein [Methylomicrobium sp. Wu6]